MLLRGCMNDVEWHEWRSHHLMGRIGAYVGELSGVGLTIAGGLQHDYWRIGSGVLTYVLGRGLMHLVDKSWQKIKREENTCSIDSKVD